METHSLPPSAVLRALADPIRQEIIDRLRQGGVAVGDLARQFPVSRPAISKHLRLLREAGLAVPRKEGRRQIYELDPQPLRALAGWLERFAGPPAGGARRPPARPTERRTPRRVPTRAPAADESWRCW